MRPKRPNGKYYRRVFVALDGEANDYGYCLLAAGRVKKALWNKKGLSTQECLNFLLSLPKGSNNGLKPIYIWFAMDYDVNMILKDVPFNAVSGGSISELRETNETTWRGYKIKYIRRKIFAVQRSGRRFNSYDVWAFFGKSFERSLEDWGVSVPEIISKGKAARGTFGQWPKQKLIDYNQAELECLEDITTQLREAIQPLDLKITSWHGPGSLAGAWLGQNGAEGWKGEKLREDLQDASLRAYFGGRIDTQGYGIIEPVYHADIVSAYPSAIRYLPDLSKIKWRKGKGSPPSAGGIYLARIQWRIPTWPKWAPFPFRNKDGSILYPPEGEGWYWFSEIEAAIKQYPNLDLEFKEYFIAEGNIEYPFLPLIEEAFKYRKELKRQNHPSHVAVKLILNSLYGKFAQTVGRNRYYSPIWAGLITAHCRAQLTSVISDDVVLMMTDSVWSKAPIPVDDSRELGGWEKGDEQKLIVAGAGLYKAIDSDGSESVYQRGFDKAKELDLEELVNIWLDVDEAYEPIFKMNRFVGMGLASMTSYPWREWVEIERRIKPLALYGTTKRFGQHPAVDQAEFRHGNFVHLPLKPRRTEEISAPYKGETIDEELRKKMLEEECSEVGNVN
jgi:DNA polymerase type B, organellar and viral